MILRVPFSCHSPMSPVWSQPSASTASRVLSGSLPCNASIEWTLRYFLDERRIYILFPQQTSFNILHLWMVKISYNDHKLSPIYIYIYILCPSTRVLKAGLRPPYIGKALSKTLPSTFDLYLWRYLVSYNDHYGVPTKEHWPGEHIQHQFCEKRTILPTIRLPLLFHIFPFWWILQVKIKLKTCCDATFI